MVAEPSVAVLRGVVTTFHILAILSTSFRLWFRAKHRRLWWDDAFAAVGLALTFMELVALWVRSDVPHHSHHARIIAYWMLSMGFTCILWSARMSMILTILRIIPRFILLHTIAFATTFLFVLLWIALIIQKAYICGHDTSWYELRRPQCHLGRAVGITELTTDIVADLILITLPLHLLWGFSTSKPRYRLLMAIFSASIFTTIVSIIHSVFLLGPTGLLEALTANVEAAVSLIVSSLGVVVTFIYRALNLGDDSQDDNYIPSEQERSSAPSSARKPGQGVISALRFVRSTHGRVDTVGGYDDDRRGTVNPMMLQDLRAGSPTRSEWTDVPPGLSEEDARKRRFSGLVHEDMDLTIAAHSKSYQSYSSTVPRAL